MSLELIEQLGFEPLVALGIEQIIDRKLGRFDEQRGMVEGEDVAFICCGSFVLVDEGALVDGEAIP